MRITFKYEMYYFLYYVMLFLISSTKNQKIKQNVYYKKKNTNTH